MVMQVEDMGVRAGIPLGCGWFGDGDPMVSLLHSSTTGLWLGTLRVRNEAARGKDPGGSGSEGG